MFLYKDKVSRKCFTTWLRRLYRGCTELTDPEITNLKSSDVKLACKDLNHRIQERVDAREEMWNGRKQEDVLREIRGVAAVSTKEESKEEDIVASKGKEEKESGFFKRFVNRGRERFRWLVLIRTGTRIRMRIRITTRTRIRTRTRKDVNIVDSICCTMYTVCRVTINILQEVWFVCLKGAL